MLDAKIKITAAVVYISLKNTILKSQVPFVVLYFEGNHRTYTWSEPLFMWLSVFWISPVQKYLFMSFAPFLTGWFCDRWVSGVLCRPWILIPSLLCSLWRLSPLLSVASCLYGPLPLLYSSVLDWCSLICLAFTACDFGVFSKKGFAYAYSL